MRHLRPPLKPWKGQETAVVEEKLDGHWLTVGRENGELYAYGRKTTPEHELSDKLERLDWFQTLRNEMPEDTMLCGELIVPGQKASAVTSGLAEDSDLPMEFRPFFMPYFKKYPVLNCSLGTHRDNLLLVCHELGLRPVRQWSWSSFESFGALDERVRIELVEPDDLEGFVFKNAVAESWWKWKPEKTVDLVCTGVKDGKGKYFGQVGALIGTVIDGDGVIDVCACSGMTDDERDHMTDLEIERRLKGRVFEVKYQYVGAKGRLRHPRFVRWRDDKPADACTIDQFSESDIALMKRS